jgi:hypothetical protein
MNPYTGHLVALADGAAVPSGYEKLEEKLAAIATVELAGRAEAQVDLAKRGPLQDWAKKKRREKMAAKSRRINRGK